MRKCTVYHIDQNLGGCGTNGARTCCKDCEDKAVCITVCTKAYEAGLCKYEEIKRGLDEYMVGVEEKLGRANTR